MDENYITRIAESKAKYHKERAKISFEEKVKIVVELQKIGLEMIRSNKNRKYPKKFRMVWEIE